MEQTKDLREGVWVTPKSFFEPLCKEFDLEIDYAASADNAMLENFWSAVNSAFNHDWLGQRIWCNPPCGRAEIYKWVQQCATGGALIVVALLPARTDTSWFYDFIYHKPNVEIRFVRGRAKFSGTTGAGKFQSMVVIFK